MIEPNLQHTLQRKNVLLWFNFITSLDVFKSLIAFHSNKSLLWQFNVAISNKNYLLRSESKVPDTSARLQPNSTIFS